MSEAVFDQAVKSAVITAFAILQVGSLFVIGTAFKMWFDVQILKKDLDAAFSKIRDMEKRRGKEEGDFLKDHVSKPRHRRSQRISRRV